MGRILLIDDDRELCEMLGDYLGAEGFRVEAVHHGGAGTERAIAGEWDAVVLDVMLPGIDGFEALRRIRRVSPVPVLMLTAKGDDVDRIVGLEIGADDYLPKPFNPRELVARLRAVLRRTQGPTGSDHQPLHCGGLEIHPGARTVSRDGQPLDLTSTEFNLLLVLVRAAGSVVDKETLSEQGLGRPQGRYDRGVDMHLSNLRRKLGSLPDGRSPIQTVRGIGYQFVLE